VFGDRITPTAENLYSWMENERSDILKFFRVRTASGADIRADTLSRDDLSDIVSVEMKDPETGRYLPCCPFLRRESRNRYSCSIHTVKSDMCCNYMPWVWGETYFPACESLKSRGRRPLPDQLSKDDTG
jgi:Fe-S-cluster containining protein